MARSQSRRPALTPTLIIIVLVLFGAVALERIGKLPEGLAAMVREIEASVLDPLLAELGFDVPELGTAGRPDAPPITRGDVDIPLMFARSLPKSPSSPNAAPATTVTSGRIGSTWTATASTRATRCWRPKASIPCAGAAMDAK